MALGHPGRAEALEAIVIVLGLILLVLGLILVVVGIVLNFVPVGGTRRHWY